MNKKMEYLKLKAKTAYNWFTTIRIFMIPSMFTTLNSFSAVHGIDQHALTSKTNEVCSACSMMCEHTMTEIGERQLECNITNESWWDTIAVMIAFAVLLSVLLITISFLLAVKKPDAEKLSPYECGFEPFGHSRQKFDIRYYLVSLLFILFDLEVVYLFPLIAVDHYVLKNTGFIIAAIFILILAIGIVYEFSKKALESV